VASAEGVLMGWVMEMVGWVWYNSVVWYGIGDRRKEKGKTTRPKGRLREGASGVVNERKDGKTKESNNKSEQSEMSRSVFGTCLLACFLLVSSVGLSFPSFLSCLLVLSLSRLFACKNGSKLCLVSFHFVHYSHICTHNTTPFVLPSKMAGLLCAELPFFFSLSL
jgi:hypothetical protein